MSNLITKNSQMISGCNDLVNALCEARQRTMGLVADLDDEQMIGPHLAIINPLRWEIGHVAWFQEYWLLRHLNGRTPILTGGDALYDSARVAHDTRWQLFLPTKTRTLAYMQRVLAQVVDCFAFKDPPAAQENRQLSKDASYFLSLVLFHEDMHAEAITYTRQTLGHPKPQFEPVRETESDSGERAEPNIAWPAPDKFGDVSIPGGTFLIGNATHLPFIFDNELRPHEIEFGPFKISRTAVTNAEYARFIDEGGYTWPEFWSEDGWSWRVSVGAKHPVYWQRGEGLWLRRNFDEIVPVELHFPVLHINWYEAEAYCRWAGRRLPTEAEWEIAASAEPDPDSQGTNGHKRRYPWGDEPPTPGRANLDWRRSGCIDVRSLPEGDSAFGCRQMMGNVWEWTASDFLPYPDFAAGPYKEYSEPWFGDHKVLRGGCWTTRSRLIHNTYRNFYKPDRRDVWAGLRTCAL